MAASSRARWSGSTPVRAPGPSRLRHGRRRRSALITCFAHGVPVVTTTPREQIDLPSQYTVPPFEDRDAFRIDDDVAALVHPGDAEALAGALAQLAGDSRRRLALARGGKQL